MKTTKNAVVRVAKGSNWVRFEIAMGGSAASMHNSKGEAAFLSASDAQSRIGLLLAAGWKSTSKTV